MFECLEDKAELLFKIAQTRITTSTNNAFQWTNRSLSTQTWKKNLECYGKA